MIFSEVPNLAVAHLLDQLQCKDGGLTPRFQSKVNQLTAYDNI